LLQRFLWQLVELDEQMMVMMMGKVRQMLSRFLVGVLHDDIRGSRK
jgi:hypothetical protein